MRIFQLPIVSSDAQAGARKKLLRPPVQPARRPFDFGFTARRPLLPLAAVLLYLNQNSRQVQVLIEDGRLRWAFDIRSSTANTRQVRVFRESLFEYAGVCAVARSDYAPEEVEFAEVVRTILPAGFVASPQNLARMRRGRLMKPARRRPGCAVTVPIHRPLFAQEPVLWGPDVARCLGCSAQHVGHLIRDGSLRSVSAPRGAKAPCLITRTSVVEFLKRRRLP